VCVGQRRPQDGDESVLLFLKMKDGERFTDSLVERVKRKIGEERSKRHIPGYVFQTWDIPVST
jgi:acetoacetyl-CoA synthetase